MANRWADTEFKYTEPPEEYYLQEMEKFDKLLTDFCDITRIDKTKVHVNIKSLKQIIKRVDMRWLYFKIYHDGMEINEYKINVGLSVFWIIKLHPFWLEVSDDEEDDELLELAEQFNEKFALHLVMDLLHEYNSNFIERGEDLVRSYCDELTYSFRYRDLSKESLFLIFDPFYYLYFFNSTISETGDLKL